MRSFSLSLLLLSSLTAAAWQPAERLDRAPVAVPGSGGVFVSWRALSADAPDTSFDVYRDGIKVNPTPITDRTNFTDVAAKPGAKYEVRTMSAGETVSTDTCTLWSEPYLKVHLSRPEAGTVEGEYYTYSPDDVMAGDVDGDGAFELIVKWKPSNARDSSFSGFTGPTILDCYRLDGTHLWSVNLGHNMRSGNHYNQVVVYDLDGDGCAEVLCKTAPGTIDGNGTPVLLGDDKVTDDFRQKVDEPRKSLGHVLSGKEYLTVFSGKTGAQIHTIPYKPDFDMGREVWGDSYGNRSDRYLVAVAYLDGEHPTALMCRGYYRAAYVWAVDFDGKHLKEKWLHSSVTTDEGLWGEGAHSVTVGDVDADGCDELVYGGACLDHDGTLLYRTDTGHGDALHLAKMLPDQPGLQVFMPHEGGSSRYKWDTEMRDAATGRVIYGSPQSGRDIGRGLAANISPLYPGYEYWSAADRGVYNSGRRVGRMRLPINFRIYWDGDLLDELLNGTQITKPTPDLTDLVELVNFNRYSNAASCSGSKRVPCLQGDLFGDWREEVVLYDGATRSDLLIFTTSIPTSHRIPTLLEDRQYRLALVWQNAAYNQPPHPSFSPEERYGSPK